MYRESDARGVVLMSGLEEQLRALYECMDVLKMTTFNTVIDECYILDCSDAATVSVVKNILDKELPPECISNLDIDTLFKRVLSNNNVLVSGFTGTGDWSYSNNIDDFLTDLDGELAWADMDLPNNLNGVELTFIYVDVNEETELLSSDQYTIRLELDGKHLVQKDVGYVGKSYDYSAENLMKLGVVDEEYYDVTEDTIPKLLLMATEDELEHLGLTGLVDEHTIKNVDTKGLLKYGIREVISDVTVLKYVLNIDKLRKRLEELKDNETYCKI